MSHRGNTRNRSFCSALLPLLLLFPSSRTSAATNPRSQPAHASPASRPSIYTLHDAYQAALQQTESVKIQTTETNIASERVSQAKGGLLPNVAFNTTYTRQDTTGTSNSLLAPNLSTVRFTLTQPLFRGGREWAGLRAAEDVQRSQQELTQEARITLFNSVGSAFFSVLAAEQDDKILQSLLELSQKRVDDLKMRTRIGKSRTAELLSAEAQVAVAKAQLEASEAAVVQNRQNFALTTGLAPDTTLTDTLDLPRALAPLDNYLIKIEQRPEIRAQIEQVRAAEENIKVARGGHLPSADLFGNYYVHRTGVYSNSKWDAGVGLTIPIFQGGIVSSQVREAAQRLGEQELLLTRARRTASKEIAVAHSAAIATLKQIIAYGASVDVAARNYRQELQDFRLGLTTNLEVIQTLNSYVQTQRSLSQATYQAKAAIVALRAAVGEIPAPNDTPSGDSSR